MNAMIAVGSQRLAALTCTGPTWIPPERAVSSSVEIEIASRKTGNAQMMSMIRDSTVSTSPPKKPATSATSVATAQQITAELLPICSELRPPYSSRAATSRPTRSAPRQYWCRSPVGPIGVSPRCRLPPPCCITGTTLPPTTVVPFRFGTSGFTCATSRAYHGASRLSTTISRNSPSAASAMRLRRSRRPASAHRLPPAIARRHPAESSTCSSSVAIGHPSLHAAYFDSHSWSMRTYHCGLHEYPWTLLDRKSICLGLYMLTQGAAFVSAWSICVHSAAAAAGFVASSDSAWLICACVDWLQYAAMFGLASLFGWMVVHPSSTFRKSDCAG